MSKQLTFNQIKESHFKKLELFVPVVDRVHGDNHPEFHHVRRLFDTILSKINESGSEKPYLDEEFSKLREITDHYTIPAGVCESYEAVYNMLADVDKAYGA